MILIFKKTRFDQKYLKIACYTFGVLAAAILFDKTIGNLGNLSSTFGQMLTAIRKLIAPFLYGFAIAYLINPSVVFIERMGFETIPPLRRLPTLRRNLAIILNYVLILGGAVWLSFYFIPEIQRSFTTFMSNLPRYMVSLQGTIDTAFAQISFINGEDVNTFINTFMQPLIEKTQNAPLIVQTILDSTFLAASTLLNIIMGIFIGFYMLSEKERFSISTRKIFYALFPKKQCDTFFRNSLRVHEMFQSFIVGKSIDSLIIGILCFLGMLLIKAPYALLISVIVGLTNMIPYFGPFIGAIPSVLITLLINPGKAVWVALFILLLQQFDGIVLGPKILGNSTGMSPIWIILSIIVGGALIGPLGMFLGVPIFASFKLFFNEYIHKKYQDKYKDAPVLSPRDVSTKWEE